MDTKITPAERIRRCLGRWEPSMVPTTANEGYARLVREEWEDAIAALAELERERDEAIRKLRDPVAVHVAMLRGEIAVPPLAELLHVYGATFSDLDAANIEIAKARETIRQLRAQLDEYERAPTFTYMYRFPHMGGFVWRHSSSDFNGARPVESIELIARPTRKDGE